MNEHSCVMCGSSFESRRRDASYCSCACRQRAHRGAVSRIMPEVRSVAVAAQDKPPAMPEPASATPLAPTSVTGKGEATWRRALVWPDVFRG